VSEGMSCDYCGKPATEIGETIHLCEKCSSRLMKELNPFNLNMKVRVVKKMFDRINKNIKKRVKAEGVLVL